MQPSFLGFSIMNLDFSQEITLWYQVCYALYSRLCLYLLISISVIFHGYQMVLVNVLDFLSFFGWNAFELIWIGFCLVEVLSCVFVLEIISLSYFISSKISCGITPFILIVSFILSLVLAYCSGYWKMLAFDNWRKDLLRIINAR